MKMSGDIELVSVTGTPAERGRAHGEAVRTALVAAMERWQDAIQVATDYHPDEYLDAFLAYSNFLPAIERWVPDLLDEVRGIAEGAALPFRDVYAYQLIDEEWEYRRRCLALKQWERLAHCSALGVFAQEGLPPLLAQNMDLPDYYDGSQVLLRLTHDDRDLESFLFAPAGVIAVAGLNSRGVGICCNTLAQLAHSERGLPVAFIVRRVLEQTTLQEAITFVQQAQHASGQNYTIGDPQQIVDLECSANKVVQFMPGSTRVYHTNHPLANTDRRPPSNGDAAPEGGKGAPVQIGATTPSVITAVSNSKQRFAYLEQMLADPAQRITVEVAQSLLSTCDEAPISVNRHNGNNSITLGSLVMELSPTPKLHLSPGPPAEHAYKTWVF